MVYFEIFSIIFLTLFQSIFGIGLLLFGTPFFLFFGRGFSETLILLLPISIVISLLQLIFSKKHDWEFIKSFNYFCIPVLIFFLFVTLHFEKYINFKLFVSFLLIISSVLMLKRDGFIKIKKSFINKKRVSLMTIGLIHGFTNMGGSFLSIYSILISDNAKNITRSNIAYGYFSMGVIQLIILLIYNFELIYQIHIFYILSALIVYYPSQYIFKLLLFKNFYLIISLIALIFGIFVFINAFINLKLIN